MLSKNGKNKSNKKTKLNEDNHMSVQGLFDSFICFIDKLKKKWYIAIPTFLIMVSWFFYSNWEKFCVTSPFTVTLQIVDWNNRQNQEIHNKGGVILFGNEEPKELTSTNRGRFKFDLSASYNKQSIKVHFQPQEQYQFMKLDTTIVVNKDSTYYLKMYFIGIDKITRNVINQTTGKPIEGAIAEINGEKDTTDKDGKFTITLPLEKQERFQKLTIKQEGNVDYVDNNLDMTIDDSIIIWDMKKK